MTNKQIRIVLASKGAGYAIISIFCASVIDIPLSYFVFKSMNIYDVAYSIPWSNNILLYILILTVCMSAPVLIYRRNQKDSIIEELRVVQKQRKFHSKCTIKYVNERYLSRIEKR